MFVDILLQHCPDFASAKYSQCIMGKSKIEAYVIGRLKSGSTPSLKWVNVEENEFSIRLVNHNNRKWKKEDGDLIEVCVISSKLPHVNITFIVICATRSYNNEYLYYLHVHYLWEINVL